MVDRWGVHDTERARDMRERKLRQKMEESFDHSLMFILLTMHVSGLFRLISASPKAMIIGITFTFKALPESRLDLAVSVLEPAKRRLDGQSYR